MSNNETAGILRESAEILGEKGWCQNVEKNHEGHMCAMGAMSRAASKLYPVGEEQGADRANWDARLDLEWSVIAALANVIGLPNGRGMNPIPNWNDMPERTAEDVILAFKRAAEHAEEQDA